MRTCVFWVQVKASCNTGAPEPNRPQDSASHSASHLMFFSKTARICPATRAQDSHTNKREGLAGARQMTGLVGSHKSRALGLWNRRDRIRSLYRKKSRCRQRVQAGMVTYIFQTSEPTSHGPQSNQRGTRNYATADSSLSSLVVSAEGLLSPFQNRYWVPAAHGRSLCRRLVCLALLLRDLFCIFGLKAFDPTTSFTI